MLVTIQSQYLTKTFSLPEDVHGAYWLSDAEGMRIAFAEASADGWLVTAAEGYELQEAHNKKESFLLSTTSTSIYRFIGSAGERLLLARPSTCGDRQSKVIGFKRDEQLSIGRAPDNIISYPLGFISSYHARLKLVDGKFSIVDLNSKNGVFVNGKRIVPSKEVALNNGDVIFIVGLIIAIGNKFISLNNPQQLVSVTMQPSFARLHLSEKNLDRHTTSVDRKYFYPALRFARSQERKSFVIDAPPQREQEDDTPLAMRIGPSLVMALASVLSASVSVMFVLEQGGSFLRAIPMVAMAIAMLTGSVLWPIISKRYQHKKTIRKEQQRKSAYSQYLGKVRSDIAKESKLQSEILHENRISAYVCMQHAKSADELFMSRIPLHKDYLELRLGVGDEPLLADIRFPDNHFNILEDDLREFVENFSKEPQVLKKVPLGYSLIEKPILGIVGKCDEYNAYLRNLLVQVSALHAYTDIKIVLMCEEAMRDEWRFVSYLPHCFSDDKSDRYFAPSLESSQALSMTLEKILEARKAMSEGFDAREAKPYYLIACPSKEVYDKIGVIKDILELKDNKGFSLIACAKNIHDLPRQCKMVINLDGERAYLINRDDPQSNRKPFVVDSSPTREEALSFALDVAKETLDISDSHEELPDRLSFMQIFNAKHVEHLNVAMRWRSNNASNSLAASVGVNALGDPFLLNLHEDFHGPHGLIAGTTGSGKSEFIITYILSIAVNYSPEDVAFVLIDYKGGGLARAFDNERIRLPHLAGTITNLDGAAISRSLISIKSELKRRQRLFNDAREVVGGDNVDIYKYLDLYRQKRVSEPCPHLMIVADEFAELKQQEPDFMDELISAARIGRSLGVHLILATQKPAGVVNDQIWSNSRFKICLKVADAADSQEMIRRPDAAEISQAGRFYLMVGYNEYFALGQSGYSGVAYNPDATNDAEKDLSVDYISDTGRILLSVKPYRHKANKDAKSEIVVLLEHLMEVAKEEDKCAQPLWLEPIPAYIDLAGLIQQFSYNTSDSFDINPVIGMYDDPANQRQDILTLPLMRDGSAIVYGAPDSGTDAILQAVLYSLISTHSVKTFNAYILDFGNQALTAFVKAPQVGDVILANDEEKIRRFFDFMARLVAQRKKMFAPYGGSFERYCEKTDGCPAILVVINGISAFLETYDRYEEQLVSFAHEALLVGMRLVIVAEGSGAVRMRLRNNFRQIISCSLADPTDYVMLFGSMRGVVQPRGYGRGLVKFDKDIFEFQAASVCAQDITPYDFIAKTCEDLARDCAETAPAIPVAPKRVVATDFQGIPIPKWQVPYGIYDDTLQIATFDFSEAPIARCVFQKRKDGAKFFAALVDVCILCFAGRVVVLDMDSMLAKQPQECNLATRKDEFAIQYLLNLIRDADDTTDEANSSVVLVSGAVDFLNRCPHENSSVFKDYLKNLDSHSSTNFIFIDSASATSLHYEDWYKVHLTNKDGLWIGAGVDSQTSINTTYSAKFLPDSRMDSSKAYAIDGGVARLVHVVSSENSKEE